MTETMPPSPRRTSRRWLIRLMNIFPPFLGAGIRVRSNDDLTAFDVRMKLRWWNRNYVGTHFGGSLYALCDPFFMLILFEALGPGYIVWDKAATIRFRRPGRGNVQARFEITPERVAEIRAAADREGKTEPTFLAEVRDAEGQLIAEVEKLLYVRRVSPLERET